MKLRPYREKRSVVNALKDIYSNADATPTAISVDINGTVNIENFKRIVDYSKEKIVLETKNKKVYLYGENLTLLSCSKHNAVCAGNIVKIELFETEV